MVRILQAIPLHLGFEARDKFTSEHGADEPGKHPPYQRDKNYGYKYVDEYSNHSVDPLSSSRATALPG
jgi:hypothetical protein